MNDYEREDALTRIRNDATIKFKDNPQSELLSDIYDQVIQYVVSQPRIRNDSGAIYDRFKTHLIDTGVATKNIANPPPYNQIHVPHTPYQSEVTPTTPPGALYHIQGLSREDSVFSPRDSIGSNNLPYPTEYNTFPVPSTDYLPTDPPILTPIAHTPNENFEMRFSDSLSSRNNSLYSISQSIPEAGCMPQGTHIVSQSSIGVNENDVFDAKKFTIDLQVNNKRKLQEYLQEKNRKFEKKKQILDSIHDNIMEKISPYHEIFTKYQELMDITKIHQDVVSDFEGSSKMTKDNYDFYEANQLGLSNNRPRSLKRNMEHQPKLETELENLSLDEISSGTDFESDGEGLVVRAERNKAWFCIECDWKNLVKNGEAPDKCFLCGELRVQSY